jgi:hypothetical protein
MAEEKPPMTPNGFNGACLVLGDGYALAIAVFIVEVVVHHRRNRNIRRKYVIVEVEAKSAAVVLGSAVIIINATKPVVEKKRQ